MVEALATAQTTDLKVSKVGNDIQLDWTTGAAAFAVCRSDNDPQFMYPSTIVEDLASGPAAYGNGLTNGIALQFLTVCGTTDDCQAGNYTGGAIPPTAPEVTGTSASTVRVGDTITFDGTGFSTIAKENVVHFPEGVTAFSTGIPTISSFDIVVPRGALSGTVVVQVGHQVSNSINLVVLTNQTNLRNLSAVAFQPKTYDIWVTTRGLGGTRSTSAYLRFTGTSWPTTTTETAVSGIMKFLGGQGFDIADSWFYGSSNDTAGGETRTIPTNPPGARSLWTSIFVPSQQVGTRAVATRPDLPDKAFFAFNNSTGNVQHIRELSGTGLVDPDYGNFGGVNLNFGSIAGLAFDQDTVPSCCNLYVSEDQQIRKIAYDESSSVILGGFTQAMGIAHDQVNEPDPGTLLVSDFGAATLYKVDLNQTSVQSTAVASLSGTRTATFANHPLASATCARLANADLSFVLGGEGNNIRQLPDPRISIEPSGPTRVWISKTRSDDVYPSVAQTLDRRITITAKVNPVPNPPRRIYFRVVDPPELSPYTDGTVLGAWCDNRDPSLVAGVFVSSGDVTAFADTDPATGKASVVMQITDQYAGENYVVQASFDDWITSNTTKALAQTGVITAWKRAYIEKDRMFRQGGQIETSAPALSTSIRVFDWAKLPDVPTCLGGSGCSSIPGGAPCFHIAVFDSLNTYEDNPEQPYVSHVTCAATGVLELHLVNADMTPYPLQKSYVASPDDFGDLAGVTTGSSAGFGVVGSGFYEAELSDQWTTFNDVYLEFWVPPENGATVPYMPRAFFDGIGTSTGPLRFSQIWFNNKNPLAPPLDWRNNAQNYFHVVGASDRTNDFGRTLASTDVSFIFLDDMDLPGACGGEPDPASCLTNLRRSTTIHEVIHQFEVNVGPNCSASRGHDWGAPTNSWTAWCGEPGGACANPVLGNTRCLMSGVPALTPGQWEQNIDEFNRLECADIALQPTNPPCNHVDCGPGVRDRSDPQ